MSTHVNLFGSYINLCLEWENYSRTVGDKEKCLLFYDEYPEIHNNIMKLLSLEVTKNNIILIGKLKQSTVLQLKEIQSSLLTITPELNAAINIILNNNNLGSNGVNGSGDTIPLYNNDNTLWFNRLIYPRIVNSNLSQLSTSDKTELLNHMLREMRYSLDPSHNYDNILTLQTISQLKYNNNDDILLKDKSGKYINQNKLYTFILNKFKEKQYDMDRTSLSIIIYELIKLLGCKLSYSYNSMPLESEFNINDDEYIFIGVKNNSNHIQIEHNLIPDVISNYKQYYILYNPKEETTFDDSMNFLNKKELEYTSDILINYYISLSNLKDIKKYNWREAKDSTISYILNEKRCKVLDLTHRTTYNNLEYYKLINNLCFDFYKFYENLNLKGRFNQFNEFLNKYFGFKIKVNKVDNYNDTAGRNKAITDIRNKLRGINGILCNNNLCYIDVSDSKWNYIINTPIPISATNLFSKLQSLIYESNIESILPETNDGSLIYFIFYNDSDDITQIDTPLIYNNPNYRELIYDLSSTLSYNCVDLLKSYRLPYNPKIENPWYQLYYNNDYAMYLYEIYNIYPCDLHKNNNYKENNCLEFNQSLQQQISRQYNTQFLTDKLHYSNNFENNQKVGIDTYQNGDIYMIGDKYSTPELLKMYYNIINKYSNSKKDENMAITNISDEFINNFYDAYEKLKFIHGSNKFGNYTAEIGYHVIMNFNYDKYIDEKYFNGQFIKLINIFYSINVPNEYRVSDRVVTKYQLSSFYNYLINDDYNKKENICHWYGMVKYAANKVKQFKKSFAKSLGITESDQYNPDLDSNRKLAEKNGDLERYSKFMDVNYIKVINAYVGFEYEDLPVYEINGLLSGIEYLYNEYIRYYEEDYAYKNYLTDEAKKKINDDLEYNEYTQSFEEGIKNIISINISDDKMNIWKKIGEAIDSIFYCTNFKGKYHDDENMNLPYYDTNNNFYKPNACDECNKNYIKFSTNKFYKIFESANKFIYIKYNYQALIDHFDYNNGKFVFKNDFDPIESIRLKQLNKTTYKCNLSPGSIYYDIKTDKVSKLKYYDLDNPISIINSEIVDVNIIFNGVKIAKNSILLDESLLDNMIILNRNEFKSLGEFKEKYPSDIFIYNNSQDDDNNYRLFIRTLNKMDNNNYLVADAYTTVINDKNESDHQFSQDTKISVPSGNIVNIYKSLNYNYINEFYILDKTQNYKYSLKTNNYNQLINSIMVEGYATLIKYYDKDSKEYNDGNRCEIKVEYIYINPETNKYIVKHQSISGNDFISEDVPLEEKYDYIILNKPSIQVENTVIKGESLKENYEIIGWYQTLYNNTILNDDVSKSDNQYIINIKNIDTTPIKFNSKMLVKDFNQLMLRKCFPNSFKDKLYPTIGAINNIDDTLYDIPYRTIKQAMFEFSKYPMFLEKYFMNSRVDYKLHGLFQLKCRCKFKTIPKLTKYLNPDQIDFTKNEIIIQGKDMIVNNGRVHSENDIYIVGIEISNNKIYDIPKILIKNTSLLYVLDFQQFTNPYNYIELYIDKYKFKDPHIVKLSHLTYNLLKNCKYTTNN